MTVDFPIDSPGFPGSLLFALVEQAQSVGVSRVALVGGAVRDLLLHHLNRDPWHEPPDLDLLLEGSSIDFVKHVQDQFGDERLSELYLHEQFGTAEVVLDCVHFDVASARTESYPSPGQNPLVLTGTIEQDLARRDFTVNAMALVLQPDGAHQLLDPQHGRDHLAKRQLAFLHSASVSDDPTRIVRGARYCARLDFHLTPDSLKQIQSTIAEWPWAWRTGDPLAAVPPALGTRLRMELELLFDREPWRKALWLLQQWSAMSLLDCQLQRDSRLSRRLAQGRRLGLPALAVLVAAATDPVSLASRLQIPRQQQLWLQGLMNCRDWLANEVTREAWSSWGALDWTQRLERQRWPSEVVALAVLDNTSFRRPLLRWWGRWRHVTSPVSAHELIAQGIPPGPELGEVLCKRREQELRKMR